ncbi:MAG: MBL fold metallo-hydrolase [Candidatus Thorarchaeota archaeon]
MGITIRYLAHASFLIRIGDQNIYIDPSTKNTGLRNEDFGEADLILVTHGHQDHFDKKLIKKIRKMGSPIIAPKNLKKEAGGGIVWDLSPGEFMKMMFADITISAVPAYNVKRFRKPGEPFHPKDLGVGYVVKIDGKKIYHAGDTDLIPEMDDWWDFDVALLPCGDTYTMDVEEASEAAIRMNPKVAIPMHTKDANPSIFREKVESASSTKVVILSKGEEYNLE